jgi:uncharacterized protein YecE (DUF72 family)
LPEIWIGCSGFTGQISAYARRLPFVELSSTFTQKHRKKYIDKLRTDGGALQFGVKAFYHATHPHSSPLYRQFPFDGPADAKPLLGLFQDSKWVKDAYQKTKDAADLLQARSILFETPTEFTPSKDNQERFIRFFSEIDRGGRLMVWSPRGPWDLEQMETLAKKTDVVIAYEPQLTPMDDDERPPEGDIGYFMLRGPSGRRRRYASFELESYLRLASQYKQCFVIFSHDAAFSDATALSQMQKSIPLEDLLLDEDEEE